MGRSTLNGMNEMIDVETNSSRVFARIAFALVVALLVAVGALGVGVLSQSNSRVEALNQLPQRAAAYQQLYNESDQLNQALGDRSDGDGAGDISIDAPTDVTSE